MDILITVGFLASLVGGVLLGIFLNKQLKTKGKKEELIKQIEENQIEN